MAQLKSEFLSGVIMSEDEKVMCSGSPSQVLNLKAHSLSLLVIAIIVSFYILIELHYLILLITAIPVFSSLWKYLQVKCLKYELTNERIKIVSGVLNKKTEEIELYRVKDSTIEEPFFYRMIGVGNIKLETSDRTLPTLLIEALPKAKEFRESLRECVEEIRSRKNVREVDFE
jgi:uncharacterized membrane protein YdbT with pleckstrin-like domain